MSQRLNVEAKMKVATWNVNSIRTRLAYLCQWLAANPVDVLCLQETKVVDADFSRASIEELGYQVYFPGQKSYNGVALLSRTPLAGVGLNLGQFLPLQEISTRCQRFNFQLNYTTEKRASSRHYKRCTSSLFRLEVTKCNNVMEIQIP